MSKGALVILVVAGWLLMPGFVAFAGQLSFSGEIDFTQKTGLLTTPPGAIPQFKLRAAQTHSHTVEVLLAGENVQTPWGKISSQLESILDFVPSSGQRTGGITIELQSKYTLIDNKPAGELQGRFEWRDKRLTINHLSSGNFRCEGFIETANPFALDVRSRWAQIALTDVARFWNSENPLPARGEVDGEARFFGALGHLLLSGTIESYDGLFDTLDFQRIRLEWEGVYPLVTVVDSQVMQNDGLSFLVSGPLDLNDLEHLDRQITDLKKDPLVESDQEKSEWTLKRSESQEKAQTTELKYLRRKDNSINTLSDEGGDLLGVEQKMKF